MEAPRPKQPGETGFALLLLVFSVTAFWQAYAISGFTGLATPGVFPMLASATMVVAATCILLQSLRSLPGGDFKSKAGLSTAGQSKAGQAMAGLSTAGQSAAGGGFFQAVLPPRLLIMVALITAYVIAMPVFGFLLASAAFLFVSFSYLWRKSLLVSVLLTVGSLASVYLVFRKLFQVVLPDGTWLQGWF